MNAAIEMTDHPETNTLSAYIDGQLGSPEHQSVMEHVTDCAECRDAVAIRRELGEEETEETPMAPVVPMRRPRWHVPAAAAAAAVVVLLFLPPLRDPVVQKYRMWQLANAVEELDERPIEARTSLSTAYRGHTIMRGDGDDNTNSAWGVEAAALRVAQTAETRDTVSSLHAAGIALLMVENTQTENYRKYGVEFLEKALRKQAGQPEQTAIDQVIAASTDAVLLNDLAAGYHATHDNEQSVKAVGRAWQLQKTPEIAWNRALILSTTQAWDDYLKLDSTSEWAKEAREKRELTTP
jgi:Putative zinc-finger